VWAQKQVTVVVDGAAFRVKTQATDVAGLLKQADVEFGQGDVITPVVSSTVSSGMTVLVRHAVPVTVRVGDTPQSLNVVGTTVADALVAVGIDPESNPAVTPAPTARLEPGMTITAPQVFARVSRERISLPFDHRTVKDSGLPVGVRRVTTPGQPGIRLRLFRAIVANGLEGPKSLVAEKTLVAPVDEVVAVGTARRCAGNRAIVASARSLQGVRSLKAPSRGRRMVCEATGYAPGSGGADHRCATGAFATHGVIAVDPRVIPLGTHVFVPGYGYAVAADTGGDIKGNRIDLCYDTYDEAIQWGRRDVTIIILD
jgi:uncharacterized protein YabE (DUF348 family)/3D (Asp-Asp-Asp) domain-containing protein